MALSKSDIKKITSLQQKKYRQEYNLFVAEGVKVVDELLQSEMELEKLIATTDFETPVNLEKIIRVSAAELKKVSKLKTPNQVVGLFKIPQQRSIENTGIIVALDGINDPGNLGTIIRLCDWFGVNSIVCATGSVDCFNPKVVQASMGSLARVNLVYTDLKVYLKSVHLPIFIADMQGANVYKTELPKEAVLVMGNEANGVSDEIVRLVKHKIAIPQVGKKQQTESLNVATATAILLSEFKRNL